MRSCAILEGSIRRKQNYDSRYYNWTILSGKQRNTPSGSQGEDRGDTVISDLVVCTEKRTRLSGCNLVPGRGDPFKFSAFVVYYEGLKTDYDPALDHSSI